MPKFDLKYGPYSIFQLFSAHEGTLQNSDFKFTEFRILGLNYDGPNSEFRIVKLYGNEK